MQNLDDLFSQIPIDQIAERFGVDTDVAKQSVAAALPALVHGLQANAQDPKGAKSLAKALKTKDSSLVDGGINLDDIDIKDGKKIVKNIFGTATPDVTARLGALNVGGKDLLKGLLPVLAPLVLALLAKKLGGDKAGGKKKDSGGGLGDILGDLLGGGGGGLGDILGNVLGGGGNSSGGLEDILGGLLGGGRR